MNPTVAQLTARSLLGRRRTLLLLALPAILVLVSIGVRTLIGTDQWMSASLLGGFTLGTMVPLLGLIVGTGAIGPEIDDGSIMYLLAKPISRATIATSKFAVAAAIITVVGAIPTLIAGLILAGTADGVAFGFAAGAAVAGLAYCGLFLLLAVVTRHAVVIGLFYALIWEGLVGGFVPGAQALSVQQWALAVTERILGDAATGLGVASAVSLGTAAVSLAIVTIGGTWYAGMRLRTLSVTSDE